MSRSGSRSPLPRGRPQSPATKDSGRKDSERHSDRTRSRSGNRDSRLREKRRSFSPRREPRPKRKDAGFKWKEGRRNENDQDKEWDSGSRRGYREQYKPRPRSRSPRRRDDRYDGPDRQRDRPREQDRDRSHRDSKRERSENKDAKVETEKKGAKQATQPAPAVATQPMIVVTVNDRLGTKKQIPCFPTDSVRDFKIIVASMIGRQPHEILLKRQGERPFKDILTLQDYGVSNNVQLDLEVDTGD